MTTDQRIEALCDKLDALHFPELMQIKTAANMVDCHRSTIERKIKSGELHWFVSPDGITVTWLICNDSGVFSCLE